MIDADVAYSGYTRSKNKSGLPFGALYGLTRDRKGLGPDHFRYAVEDHDAIDIVAPDDHHWAFRSITSRSMVIAHEDIISGDIGA